jgi:hypothetical protein
MKNKAPNAIDMTNIKFAKYECAKNFIIASDAFSELPPANKLNANPTATRITPKATKIGVNFLQPSGNWIDSGSYFRLITGFYFVV